MRHNKQGPDNKWTSSSSDYSPSSDPRYPRHTTQNKKIIKRSRNMVTSPSQHFDGQSRHINHTSVLCQTDDITVTTSAPRPSSDVNISDPIARLTDQHQRWTNDSRFNSTAQRTQPIHFTPNILTGLNNNDISIRRGLTDDECEQVADYVALHNAFEAMDITTLRGLKADIIRHSKVLRRVDTKLYDHIRVPDMYTILEMTINKRLVHELAFATFVSNNVTLQHRMNELHLTSNGQCNDSRDSIYAQIRDSILTNLNYMLGSRSHHLPKPLN
jgi:hypothetical protein